MIMFSSRNRGVEEWQIYIPRGSRNMKSIPRGPRGISRNDLFNFTFKNLILWNFGDFKNFQKKQIFSLPYNAVGKIKKIGAFYLSNTHN